MKTKLLLLLAIIMTAFSVNAQINSVAIVGNAFGGDFPSGNEIDVNQLTLVSGTTDQYVLNDLVATNGKFKFRANNSWSIDANIWGTSQPSQTIVTSGPLVNPGNDVGIIAGTYTVNFNTTTGIFSLTGGAPIPVVKLVGPAVTGNTITMNPQAAGIYSLPLTTFLAGTANFEVDGVLIAGGNTFPGGDTSTGTGIPVLAGAYTSVTYNNELGTYVFVAAPTTFKISIVGNATASGWPPNSPPAGYTDPIIMKNVENSNENYRISEIPLTIIGGDGNPGKIKFRENDAWSPSYGGQSFPTGPVAGNGGDIELLAPNVSGDYSATFVRSTGAYSFFTPKIGLIGDGNGGWGEGDEVPMITTNGITYTLLNRVIIGGPVKFRLDQNWDKSWGGVYGNGSGIGTTSSGTPNITVPAGTYDIQFNRLTGAFVFATPGTLASNSFSNKSFSASPNPTNDNWNFTSTKDAITSVQVIDMLGKVVATSTSSVVDASALNTGVYFAKVSSAAATATVKVVRN